MASVCTAASAAAPSASTRSSPFFRLSIQCIYPPALARIDGIRGNEAQRGDAGYKEIISAAQLDKIGKAAAHERRIAGICGALNHEFSGVFVVAQQRVFIVALP